jgi:hypothetical protein
MLTSAHKLMPEITNVRFSCGNSNIRDLLQILATEIQTNFNNSPRQNVPKLCWKVKKICPQNRLKNTRCKGVHVIERPAWPTQSFGKKVSNFHFIIKEWSFPRILETAWWQYQMSRLLLIITYWIENRALIHLRTFSINNIGWFVM